MSNSPGSSHRMSHEEIAASALVRYRTYYGEHEIHHTLVILSEDEGPGMTTIICSEWHFPLGTVERQRKRLDSHANAD